MTNSGPKGTKPRRQRPAERPKASASPARGRRAQTGSPPSKDGGIIAELNRLKRQLFVLERMRFESLRQPRAGGAAAADAGLLAAGVAHEFNNILGAADGHAEWALDSGKVADLREALTIVRQACARSVQVTRALQGLAQPREESRALFALEGLLAELERLFAARAKLDGVDFTVATLKQPAYGDYGRLLEVLVNLVKNAFEAVATTAEAGARRVRVSATERENDLVIRVEDSGAGVPPSLHTLIFQPFFTTKGVLHRVSADAEIVGDAAAGTGSGLGLFLSRTIMEEHGGTLRIVPIGSGLGGAFELTLPKVDL